MSDYRDLGLEMLADSEALLLDERVGSLESDVVTYRELAQAAITKLHEQHEEIMRLRAQIRDQREQIRCLVAASRAASSEAA